jgi:hypothetical protein
MKAKELIKLIEEEPVSTPDFNQALNDFIFDCQGKIDAYYTRQYDNLNPPKLEILEGSKRVHIIEAQQGVKGGKPPDTPQRSSWALVDKETGDVFKPARWGVPAKGARANIFKKWTWANVGPYGPAYGRRPMV